MSLVMGLGVGACSRFGFGASGESENQGPAAGGPRTKGNGGAGDQRGPGDTLSNAAPTVTIVTPHGGSVFDPGDLISFAANATDEAVEQLVVRWESDTDGLLNSDSPDSTGNVAFSSDTLSIGSHLISLSVEDAQGEAAADTVTLRINAPPIATCDQPAGGSTFEAGWAVRLAGTVSDTEDAAATLSAEWVSDRDGLLATPTVDGGGGVEHTISTLSIGTHVVTLRVSDNDGATSEDACTFEIEPARSYAFITSQAVSLDIGGLAGADALCAQNAVDAGLPGSFVAWL